MSELEEMLEKVLGDPRQMELIGGLASRLMGAGEKKGEAPSEPVPGLEPGMLESMGRIMSRLGQPNDKAALVAALSPYLGPERRSRLEKALRISRLAGIAGAALEEYGDGSV